MKVLRVKDIMVPIEEYTVVSMNSTLREALKELSTKIDQTPAGQHPHRAVLAVNSKGNVVGKLGLLTFLKALEPKYGNLGDIERLSRAGVSVEFLDSMMEELGFWQEGANIICQRANEIRVKDVMKHVEENIDEDALLFESMHKIIMWQALSILVTKDGKVTGVLRLSDLFKAVSEYILSEECENFAD